MAAWIEELFPAKYKIEDLLDDIGIAVGEEKSARSQKTYEDNFHSYLLKYETDRSKVNVKFKIENENEKKESKTEEVQPSFGEVVVFSSFCQKFTKLDELMNFLEIDKTTFDNGYKQYSNTRDVDDFGYTNTRDNMYKIDSRAGELQNHPLK